MVVKRTKRDWWDCAYEVWSSGTETWEGVAIDPTRILVGADMLEYVHSKPVNNVLYDFFKDKLDRWFRCARTKGER